MKTISFLTAAVVVFLPAAASLAQAPWDVNTPIVTVQKEIYAPSPAAGVCQWCWSYYIGPDGQMVENYVQESAATYDDFHVNAQRRFSDDNGQTWTPLETRTPDITHQISYGGVTKWVQEPRLERPFYDPVAGVVLRFYDQCTDFIHDPLYHHQFYDLSSDYGRTYGAWNAATQSYSDPAKLVAYEPWTSTQGDQTYRGPEDFFNESYLTHNFAYGGNSTIRLSNGTIVTALTETYVTLDGQRLPFGSRCLIGTWDAPAHDYDWQFGESVSVPTSVSSRGLMEGHVAELTDGRVMITWRNNSGHRYYGVSTDGGLTISQPDELKYDDGTSFYSPSSISEMIRSSDTGKLYFVGNMCMSPPSGNSPRYPLVIAEINETGTPTIKKDTVTVIDTIQPGESTGVQLSNFSLLENKATQKVELMVSPLGYIGGYEAPVRKYTLTFGSPPPLPDEAVRTIYCEIFPNTTGVRGPLMTEGWQAHGGSNAAVIGYSSSGDPVTLGTSNGPAPPPAIHSNPSDPYTDLGYTYHETWKGPAAGEPHIIWTNEYTVDDSWKLTEVRWEQLLNNASLTPAFAVKVGSDWFVTNQTGTIENADSLFDVVSIDLMTATWSALDFEPGALLAKGDLVASLPEGDISAFGLFIDETPANAQLRFDNVTLLARMFIPGDLNGDGFVGATDLDIVRAHWGQYVPVGSRRNGDLSGDGFVGGADLDLVRANWGHGTPPVPGGVPEPGVPTGLASAAIAWLLASTLRRRNP